MEDAIKINGGDRHVRHQSVGKALGIVQLNSKFNIYTSIDKQPTKVII